MVMSVFSVGSWCFIRVRYVVTTSVQLVVPCRRAAWNDEIVSSSTVN